MKPALSFFSITAFLFCATVTAQKNSGITSPDGNLSFSFSLKNTMPHYRVDYKGTMLIDDSPLSLEFDNGLFQKNIRLNKTIHRDAGEDYELLAGKAKKVHVQYREAIFPLEETRAPFRKLNLAVRVFNDGLAFRYQFPQQQNFSSLTILDENTTFNIKGNPIVTTLLLPSYTSSHEGLYTHLSLNDLPADTLMDMPSLFAFPNGVFMGITEAALLDYAGMYLSKHTDQLVAKLSPLPGQTAVKVKASFPHNSPWRVLLISDRVGALLESNIITALNEPCKLSDVSWIKPGKSTFPWWNGNVVPDTLNAPGNNFVTAQYYIDFCARNGLEYHSVVEYGLHQWYVDDGVGFQPGPNNDVTKPVPGLNMKEICDYAATKGVGIRVWVHWAALYPKLDSAFAVFEKWGLKGMMVDFMDRDDQEMVNIQTEILQKAAKHHLHIQFHGAYKPTGINRTYPNELTREGTLNYEVDKWDAKGLPPDHDLDIPFTRMLAGAADYHLGGFRAVKPSQFKTQYTRPLVLGTRSHMMAMYIVLESYLHMVCDYPAAYEGQEGFDFITKIPTVWDETKVLAADPGSYLIIARRTGKDWYVGAINNSKSKSETIDLSFLDEGSYSMEMYSDAAEDSPNGVIKQGKIVTNTNKIILQFSAGGGAALHFVKRP